MFKKQGEELFSKMMNESNSDGIFLYQFNGEISENNLNLNLVQGYLPTKEMHTCILWKIVNR